MYTIINASDSKQPTILEVIPGIVFVAGVLTFLLVPMFLNPAVPLERTQKKLTQAQLQDLSGSEIGYKQSEIYLRGKTNNGIQVNAQAPVVEAKSSKPAVSPTVEVPKETIKEEGTKAEVKVDTQIKSSNRYNCIYGNKAIQNAINLAAKEYEINCKYLITIGLSENIEAPHMVGDKGCSFGIYQMNLCVHKTTTLNPSIMDCAKDFLCSSRWTAFRVRYVYCRATVCTNWINQLKTHNGFRGVPQWYINKINKNGIKVGLPA